MARSRREPSRHRAGGCLAEAGLGVTVPGAGGEPGAVILGQADRIELGDGAAAVLDYKSGSLPAEGPEAAHLAQLACYRLALQRLYPNAEVRAAIFDTGSGNAREAPGQDLDAVLMQVLGRALIQRPEVLTLLRHREQSRSRKHGPVSRHRGFAASR